MRRRLRVGQRGGHPEGWSAVDDVRGGMVGGFSPMTLAWVLRSLPVERAGALGFDEGVLTAFRDDLVVQLTRE